MTKLPITGDFRITATFGQSGKYWKSGHKGIDFYADNRNVYCTCEGKVRYIGFDGDGWGRYVDVLDNEGNRHIFCHLVKDSVKVSVGQSVNPLTVLGTMGSTGNSTGVHLHYQINDSSNTPIDPSVYMGIPNEKGNYNSKEFQIMFKDQNKIAQWAADAVKTVYENGIMAGDADGNFRPEDSVTRQELAVVLAKIIERIG